MWSQNGDDFPPAEQFRGPRWGSNSITTFPASTRFIELTELFSTDWRHNASRALLCSRLVNKKQYDADSIERPLRFQKKIASKH